MKFNWTRFNRYLYKYWKLQAVVIGLGLVTMPLTLLNPYLTKLVIDKAYGNRDLKLFFILAAIGGSVFIINGIFGFLSSYLSKYVDRKVSFDLTKDLFRKLQSLPLNFYNDRSTGEYIYRVNSDVNSVSSFVCSVIPQMVTLFPRLIFILVIVFRLNWKLALFASSLVLITYAQPYLFGKWLKEITRAKIQKAQGIFKRLNEVFSHTHLIKALGKERHEIGEFEENLKKRMNFELKNARVQQMSNFSSSIMTKAISGLIALYGGYQVIKGAMTLGSLTAIMIYLTQLIGLLKSVGKFYQTIIINSVARQRLEEIFDIKSAIRDAKDAVAGPIEKGRIEFRNVVFGYKRGLPILKNINFAIEPSLKVALVGLSGCGKSTILSLILRLYEQEKGTILVDGIDTKKMKLDSLKLQIGIALQEPFLWNDTVFNNIAYGANNPTSSISPRNPINDDVVKAANLACAHDFILNLPKKYDTVIGEMACKISEGQKQRIAIARAVIKKPKILILDEAMSSLDSQTEDKITENIRNEFKDSTVITVSHRLSTVRKADRVCFLEDGATVESGRHEEFLEKNAKYRELFASQMK